MKKVKKTETSRMDECCRKRFADCDSVELNKVVKECKLGRQWQ